MKTKIILLLVAVFGLQLVNAQSSKVSTAYFLMSDYKDSKNAKDILKAKDAIDAATENETTSLQGKTWYYRGLIYDMLANDETTKADGTDYTAEALISYEKSLTIKDKKFRDDDKVLDILNRMAVNSFNDGVNIFKTEDYKTAYSKFLNVQSINAIITKSGGDAPVDNLTALEYTGIAASNAGMNQEAIDAYSKLIPLDTKNNHYLKIAKLYKANGQEDLYIQNLDKGAELFPNDVDIIFAQLNILIKANKTEEALTVIDKAIALQPENAQLYFVKAHSLEAMGNADDALVWYKKSLEKDPENKDTYNNIAAVYTKKAKVLYKEMNNLDMGANYDSKYEEINTRRKAILKNAIPFLEKSLELFPDDAATKKSLGQMSRIVNE